MEFPGAGCQGAVRGVWVQLGSKNKKKATLLNVAFLHCAAIARLRLLL